MLEPGLQSPVLLFACHMDEQLDDGRARIALLRLEFVDLVIAAAPFRLARKFLDPFDQHAAIPAPVEDRDIAVAR